MGRIRHVVGAGRAAPPAREVGPAVRLEADVSEFLFAALVEHKILTWILAAVERHRD